ncbi:MAG: GerAB/ArcD/ProY family transporter, partial [Alicyclobacillaceae bacterium]|nr:GerAB/ArcD/ProY family transporter [Alicyclobacillaceae bacterium]
HQTRGVTVFDSLFQNRMVQLTLNGLLVVAFVLNAGVILRTAIDLIEYIALPYTPAFVLAALGMLVPLQLFTGGFDAVLRYGVALFWPTVLVGVTMLLLCLEVSDIANVFPLWPTDWRPVLGALPRVLYLLPGFMLCAVYLPLFRWASVETDVIRRMVFTGVVSSITLQVLNVGVVLVDFGPFEGAALNWPVIEAVRIQHGGRWAVLFLLPVLIAVSSAVNLYTYAAYRIAVYYTRIRRLFVVAVPLLGVVVGLSMVPTSLESVFRYYTPVSEAIEVVIFAAMLGLWVRLALKGGRKRW